jgi:3'-5' exoribonuclease 1
MMKYIVFDVEFNGNNHFTPKPMECFEIGAFKLDSNFQIEDSFHSYIKTKFKLNKYVKELTGVNPDVVGRSPNFPFVIHKFKQWIGHDYVLISWGNEDRIRLYSDCKMHGLKTKWLYRYIDLQNRYKIANNNTDEIGLQQVIQKLNINRKKRNEHTALSDALDTVFVLQRIRKQIDLSYFDDFESFKKKMESPITKFISQKIYQICKSLYENDQEITWDNVKNNPFIKDLYNMGRIQKNNEIFFINEMNKQKEKIIKSSNQIK